MTGARNMIDIKVRWSEADPAGIAFYPRFFEWFDMATEALFESLEMPWPVLFPRYRVVGVPIVDVGAEKDCWGSSRFRLVMFSFSCRRSASIPARHTHCSTRRAVLIPAPDRG
jgi:hypothetical protein